MLRRAQLPGRWWPLIAIAALCIVLAAGGDDVREWGRYEREALEAGELWRLATAHVVHLGWAHLALNLVALVLLAVLFDGLLTGREWAVAAVLGAAGINLGLYLLDEQIEWYVGMSGVLHAVFAFASVKLIHARSRSGLLFGGALAAKLAWEQWAGPLPVSGAAMPVITEAHLYGAVAGALAASVWAAIGSRRAAASRARHRRASGERLE